VTPNWQDQGWGPLNPRFRGGEVAMINQGPWELYQNIEIDEIFNGGLNLGILQLPHDESGNQGAPIGGHGYVISSHVNENSLEFNASLLFSRFMSSQYAQKLGAIDFYHVPSRQSVMELPEVQSSDSYEYVEAYWNAVQTAIRLPVAKDWTSIEYDFGFHIDGYLSGGLTIDECINETLSAWGYYLPIKNQVDEPPDDEPTDDEPTDDEPTDDEPTDDDPTDDTNIDFSSISAYPMLTFASLLSISMLFLRNRNK